MPRIDLTGEGCHDGNGPALPGNRSIDLLRIRSKVLLLVLIVQAYDLRALERVRKDTCKCLHITARHPASGESKSVVNKDKHRSRFIEEDL
jgi:hypothetical protein